MVAPTEDAARSEYLPSPSQIREECRKIQQTWSPAEERNRRGASNWRWQSPSFVRLASGEYVKT